MIRKMEEKPLLLGKGCPIVDDVSRRNNHAERQGEPVLPLSAERAFNLRAPAPQGQGPLFIINPDS